MSTTPTLPPPLYPADEGVRASEVFPFRSGKISIRRSRALIPLAMTAVVCVALFGALRAVTSPADMMPYMVILAAYVVSMIFLGLYLYSGERRNILWYFLPPLLTALQLVFVFKYYAYLFRTLLPGNTDAKGFGAAFVGNFFGAGLCEELLKAGAPLLGLLVALLLRASGRRGIALVRGLALQGPVDGLLMGAAAGAGFIMLETLLQYVPDIIKHFNSDARGYLYGIGLLIPRVLNGVIGHMAWAGIFGYFIGLAVNHRRSAIPLVLGGWFIAGALHGFWNASAQVPGESVSSISAAVSLAIFVACLLKAKQLELSRVGGMADGNSILALSPSGAAVWAPSYLAAPVVAAAAYQADTSSGGFAPVPATGLSIGAGGPRYALAPDAVIDFSTLFAGAGVPAGCLGMVLAAPDGGLDLRNTGAVAWAAAGPDGATVVVPPAAGIRAVAGLRIALDRATVDVQPY